jgi:hypothetical protein
MPHQKNEFVKQINFYTTALHIFFGPCQLNVV